MTYKKNPKTKRTLKNLNKALLDRERGQRSELHQIRMRASDNKSQLLFKER